MTNLDKLINYFEKFPGTGLRQARRFAFHILTLKPEQVKELSELITSIQQSVTECSQCHRFFSTSGIRQPDCQLCSDANRDRSKLVIVARDTDIEAIERSGVYDGLYFVLGGTVALLGSKDNPEKIRTGALKATITDRVAKQNLKEVILAFAVNPDGENTGRFVENLCQEFTAAKALNISYLGRGLSTGSELEYADPETIKNALAHRTHTLTS